MIVLPERPTFEWLTLDAILFVGAAILVGFVLLAFPLLSLAIGVFAFGALASRDRFPADDGDAAAPGGSSSS